VTCGIHCHFLRPGCSIWAALSLPMEPSPH
jgi:hypothetical protein